MGIGIAKMCINTKKQMGIGIWTLKNRWESVSLRCALSCEYGVHVNSRDLHDILSQPSRPLPSAWNCCLIKWEEKLF